MPDQNPYEFIMADKQKKRFAFSLPAGKQKKLVIIIGGLVSLAILMFAISFIFGGNGNMTKVYEVAAAQADIVGLTKNNSAKDIALSNKAATYLLVISSQANDTEEYLKKHGVENLDKKIAPYQDEHYKDSLKTAKASGQYDETFKALLANKSDIYRAKLQAAYASTGSKTLKNLLSSQYSQISTLGSN